MNDFDTMVEILKRWELDDCSVDWANAKVKDEKDGKCITLSQGSGDNENVIVIFFDEQGKIIGG